MCRPLDLSTTESRFDTTCSASLAGHLQAIVPSPLGNPLSQASFMPFLQNHLIHGGTSMCMINCCIAGTARLTSSLGVRSRLRSARVAN